MKKYLPNILFLLFFLLLTSRLAVVNVFAYGRSDAMMVYGTNEAETSTTFYPQYKIWDGTSWGMGSNASPVNGEIRHLVVKYAPTRDEIMLVILTSTGELQAQVHDGTSWGTVEILDTITDAGGSPTTQSLYKGFDVEYEQSSGDAVIIYGDGSADPDFRVWDGNSWSDPTDVDVPNVNVPNWIELAADPGSDDLGMILLDGSGDIYGMRWDGSAWDNMGTSTVWDTGASIVTKKSMDVTFETNSGDIMFLWGTSNTTNDHRYRTYVGSTLSSISNLPNSRAGGQPHWIKLAPNPNPSSNQIMLGTLDGGADLNTFIWGGSSWSAVHAEHDAATENILDMNFDIVFETHSSNTDDAVLVWGNGATISRKLWTGSWGTASTVGDDTAQIYLSAQPNSGALMTIAYQDATSATDDITEMNQTGGVQTWSTPSIIWGGPTARRPGNFYVGLDSQSYNSSENMIVVYDAQIKHEVPKYRRWQNNAWGAENSTNEVSGPINHMDLKFSPTRNEAILISQDQSGGLTAQVWNGSTWNTPQVIGDVGSLQNLYKAFDFDYEQLSGDAVIVYGDDTSNPNYRVWNGSSWSAEIDIAVPTTGIPRWIETSANYGSFSDELAFILLDSNTDVYGMRWNGSDWDNMGESSVWDDTAGIATRKGVDVAFERNSGDILFIWTDSVNTRHWNYRTYSSSSLGAVTALTNANNGGIGHWVLAVANPLSTSDQIMIGGQDAGNDFNTRLWNGSSWDTAPVEHTANCENVGNICFDIAFETYNPDAAWIAYGNGSTLSRRKWTGASWATATTSGDDTIDVDLEVHPISGAVLGLAYQDDTSDSDDIVEFNIYNGGTTWNADTIIWDGPVRATNGLTLISLATEQYYVHFVQNDFEFFVDDTSVNLANAWPPGNGSDIEENTALTPLPATNSPPENEEKIRIQMNVGSSNRSIIADFFSFVLQYVAAEDCTTATGWVDVGDIGSGEIWRLFDNASLSSSVTQVNQISTSSSGAEGLYSESNPTSNNPNLVSQSLGQYSEWDWPVQNNGALENTSYCFRMIENPSYEFTTYNADSYPKIVTKPGTSSLMRHGSYFQNESEKGFIWAN